MKEHWCIPEVNTEFVAAMEDVFDLYAEPYDPQRPKVNFDETSKQVIQESRQALPAQPGKPQRYDYEYERRARAICFCSPNPKRDGGTST